jgi:N-acetylglutamate synthase-like GNAT family acetyltransferase
MNAEARTITKIPVGMRPGVRQLNDASLKVSVPDAVPESMRSHMREITNVYVDPASRRKHLATALLNLVCQEADANKITLLLTAHPEESDGPTEEQLIDWYKCFGFQKLQHTDNGWLMARRVYEKPRLVSVTQAVREAVREALAPQEVH